jgi:hypothetical protein
LKCQGACSFDKALNAFLPPLVEINLAHDVYGGEGSSFGSGLPIETAVKSVDYSTKFAEYWAENNVALQTQKYSIEQMIRSAKVLQEHLNQALEAENVAKRAKMLGEALVIAEATYGYIECYEKHCAKCLDND